MRLYQELLHLHIVCRPGCAFLQHLSRRKPQERMPKWTSRALYRRCRALSSMQRLKVSSYVVGVSLRPCLLKDLSGRGCNVTEGTRHSGAVLRMMNTSRRKSQPYVSAPRFVLLSPSLVTTMSGVWGGLCFHDNNTRGRSATPSAPMMAKGATRVFKA